MSAAHRGTGSRSAWRSSFDDRMRDQFGDGPIRCTYIGELPGPCTGPIERHHPVELTDGGDREWTVPACKGHHEAMTTKNRTARKNTPRKNTTRATTPRDRTARPKTAPAQASPDEARPVAAQAGLLIWLALLAWAVVRKDAGIAAWATAAAATAAAAAGYVKGTQERRADVVTRIRIIVARGLNADPAHVGQSRRGLRPVSEWGWAGIWKVRPLAGAITYPVSADDSPGSKPRADVEAAMRDKAGADITWQQTADMLTWTARSHTPRHPAGHADTDMSTPGTDTADTPPVHDPLPGTIAEDLNATFKTKTPITVRVVSSDATGPTRIDVNYPPGFRDDQPDRRADLVARIAHTTGGLRFKPTWETRTKCVTLHRRPQMPVVIPFPLDQKTNKRYLIPLGMGEHHDVVAWDMKVSPHLIVAGETGAGKTYALTVLVYGLLLRGWQLILIDGKGTSFASFRHLPGVICVGLGDPESMSNAFEKAESLIRRRYREVLENDREPSSFTPVCVLADEVGQAVEDVQQWWDSTRDRSPRSSDPKTAPGLGALSTVARIGRECGVHSVAALQQAASRFFGDTEARDNFGARLGLGPLSQQGAQMMFGASDIGRDVPGEFKGRSTFMPSKNADAPEVQMFFAPRPLPSGRFTADAETFLTDLTARINAAQPAGHKARREVQAEYVSFDDLAAALRDGSTPRILLDQAPVTVTAVEEGDENVVARLYYRDADGNEQVAEFTSEEEFELAQP